MRPIRPYSEYFFKKEPALTSKPFSCDKPYERCVVYGVEQVCVSAVPTPAEDWASNVPDTGRMEKGMAYLSFLLLIGFVTIAALPWFLCTRLMYPERVPSLPYTSVQLETVDHVTIRGWFIPAPPDTGRAPSVLLLHGVADNRNAFHLDCRASDSKNNCPPNSP